MKSTKAIMLAILLGISFSSLAQQFYKDIEGWKKDHSSNSKVVIIGFITSDCVNCYVSFTPTLKAFFKSDYAKKNDIILLAPSGVRQKEYLEFISKSFGKIDTEISFVINSSLYRTMESGIKSALFYSIYDINNFKVISQGSLKNLNDVNRFEMLFMSR